MDGGEEKEEKEEKEKEGNVQDWSIHGTRILCL